MSPSFGWFSLRQFNFLSAVVSSHISLLLLLIFWSPARWERYVSLPWDPSGMLTGLPVYMYKMNTALNVNALLLQLQKLVFQLEMEQLGVDALEPHWVCFPLFCSSHASFECSASSDGFIILPLLLPCLVFLPSSSPPRGIAVRMPGVDRGTEKPVDDCLHGNLEEYASVYKGEWGFFSMFAFLFFSLFSFVSLCLVFPPPIPITPATCYETCLLHPAIISRHFLAAFKTQTLCVFFLGGGHLDRIRGYCSLLKQQVLIWLHSGGFVCSTFVLPQHRKGRAAQAEGHCRDKRKGAFYLPYFLVGSVSKAFSFRYFKALALFVLWKDFNFHKLISQIQDIILSRFEFLTLPCSPVSPPGYPVLRRQVVRGLLSTHERQSPLQLSRPQKRWRLHQSDGAEINRLGHLPV